MPPDSGSTWKGGKGEAGDPGMAQLPGPKGHRSPLPLPGQTRRQRGRPRLTQKFPCRLGPGGPFSLLTESGSAVGVLPGPPLWCVCSVLPSVLSLAPGGGLCWLSQAPATCSAAVCVCTRTHGRGTQGWPPVAVDGEIVSSVCLVQLGGSSAAGGLSRVQPARPVLRLSVHRSFVP